MLTMERELCTEGQLCTSKHYPSSIHNKNSRRHGPGATYNTRLCGLLCNIPVNIGRLLATWLVVIEH